MSKTVNKLIQAAQDNLLSKSYDIGHDYFHHYKVWENCLEIISAENLKNINLDYLQIAAWWHDVDRKTTEHQRLVKAAKDLQLSSTYIQNILDIINSHSISDTSNNDIESKILFDADKVEYIGPARLLKISMAISLGDISLEYGLKYPNAINNRMSEVMKRLNFSYTETLLKKNLQILKYIKEEKLFVNKFEEALDWKMLDELILE